jgi:hypothetical protein
MKKAARPTPSGARARHGQDVFSLRGLHRPMTAIATTAMMLVEMKNRDFLTWGRHAQMSLLGRWATPARKM